LAPKRKHGTRRARRVSTYLVTAIAVGLSKARKKGAKVPKKKSSKKKS
jgi:hypothetical protein